MTYAKVENGKITEYPVYPGDIIQRHPSTSFPIPFEAPEGYQLVEPAPQPSIDYTQNLVEGEPELTDEGILQVWIVEDATDEQIQQRTDDKAALVRSERNSLLAQCDWTQLPDSTVDKELWAEYRQLLRDVTAQAGFPWNVQWPDKPD